MKKHKICKILLVILAIFLCVAFYELLGICVAYKKQPEVSNTTKKETKNGSWNECSENTERAVIIEKNPEALLQRVRLIKNAKKEIILSTFAFRIKRTLCKSASGFFSMITARSIFSLRSFHESFCVSFLMVLDTSGRFLYAIQIPNDS